MLVRQKRCLSVDLATDSKQSECVLWQVPDFSFVNPFPSLEDPPNGDFEDVAAQCILPDAVPELWRHAKKRRSRVGFDTVPVQSPSLLSAEMPVSYALTCLPALRLTSSIPFASRLTGPIWRLFVCPRVSWGPFMVAVSDCCSVLSDLIMSLA